jgi:hypothetical protein
MNKSLPIYNALNGCLTTLHPETLLKINFKSNKSIAPAIAVK